MRTDLATTDPARHSTGLVDVLDRVLDKGLLVAGDVRISLAEVELLTIRIRLIVCSIDKAQQIGLDWWRYDRHFAPGQQRATGGGEAALRRQVRALEQRLQAMERERAEARPRTRRTTRTRVKR
jgi:hypothetical protein